MPQAGEQVVTGAGDQRDQGGDPDRRAELARHPEDRGPGRDPLRGQRGGDHGGQGAEHHADAGAAEHEAGQEGARVFRAGADRGEDVGEAGGEGQATGDDHRPLTDPGAEPAGWDREGRCHQRAGGEGEAGLQRRVAPDLGQHQDSGEQHRSEAGEEDRRRQVAEGEGADPQQWQLDHRRVMLGGAADEGDDQGDRAGEAGQGPRVGPAPVGALDDPEGEQGDAEGQLGGAEQVGAAVFGLADLTQGAGGQDRDDDPDRHVDDEDPAPAELHQQAADRRPECRRDAADRGPDADRQRPLLDREGGQDQPQGGRDHHRPAGCLQDPCRDQEGDRGGGGAEGRGRREEEQAGDEDALAADPVGDPPGGDEQRREDDRVGVQHPGEAGEGGAVELGGHVREGDVDDEEIEAGHEEADRGDQEDLPALLHACS